jgi:hypothetical protein
MKNWIVAALLAFCFGRADGQEFRQVKTWTFVLANGSLKVDLKASPDGTSSLGLGPSGQTPEAPLSEQIIPISKVLTEMPGLGLDPHKVVYIGTRIFTHDVLAKLAYACADSQAWRSSMQDRGSGKEQVLLSLLNQSHAYDAYNQIFGEYGLKVQVASVENLGLMRFSSVAARDDRDRHDSHLLVAADAIIGMKLSPL